jgi:copper chaperone CopZ
MPSFADIKKQIREVEPQQEEVDPVEVSVESDVPEIINKYEFDPKKTYIIVNGKAKEISSKSKYLLDMLIIEETGS